MRSPGLLSLRPQNPPPREPGSMRRDERRMYDSRCRVTLDKAVISVTAVTKVLNRGMLGPVRWLNSTPSDAVDT
jgi:hypothetical protein